MEYKYTGNKGDLFKEILEFKREHEIQGYSMFQVIMIFCAEHDYHEEEIGEILKKDSAFKNMFKEDLKLHNEAFFKNETKPETKTTLGDWI